MYSMIAFQCTGSIDLACPTYCVYILCVLDAIDTGSNEGLKFRYRVCRQTHTVVINAEAAGNIGDCFR